MRSKHTPTQKYLPRHIVCTALSMVFCIIASGHTEPMHRVISLAPNITEMIYTLGAEEQLVGVTDACDYPPSANRRPSTGPYGEPSVEKIASLAPDLVLYMDVKDPSFRQKMAALHIPAIQLPFEHFADLQRQMLKIGDLLGRPAQARFIVKQWEERLRAVKQRTNGLRPLRVYFELWRSPAITAGRGSFIDEAIRLAGGTNIARTLLSAYPKPSEEFVINADPEVIVLGYTRTKSTTFPKSWEAVTAMKHGLLIDDLNNDLLLRPGPRIFDGLESLQQRFEKARESLNEKK